VDVPEMNFIAVSGKGDPNQPDGAYKKAVGMLYTIAYTIKMSRKTDHRIEGYFDYVVPPLEGFWRQEGREEMDYSHKEDFIWTSVIRLPDFVTEADFRWAVQEAERKKHMDLSKAEFLRIREGLCVQCMHIGPYDDEPETVSKMDRFLEEYGYENDFSEERIHHEIYLSDVTRTAPAKLKTVIRHPVRRK
jgi:hypothetical protein